MRGSATLISARLVLDAWAVLAWLQAEPGGALVRDLIDWADGNEAAGRKARRALRIRVGRPELLISIVNLGEVFYIIGRRRGEREAGETVDEIRASPITIIPAPDALVMHAARIKLKHSVAYADAFAVATALSQGASLVSGDPELRLLKDVPVLWVGRAER